MYLEEEERGIPPKKHYPHSETRWEYHAAGMLQCVWNWKSCQSGRNHEEIRICEDFERNWIWVINLSSKKTPNICHS